jgi:hypothetical protein
MFSSSFYDTSKCKLGTALSKGQHSKDAHTSEDTLNWNFGEGPKMQSFC